MSSGGKRKSKNSSMNLDRTVPKGSTHLRDKATIKRLSMYSQKPIRDKKGKILKHEFQSKDTSHNTRIQPDRRWFGNTRTVNQKELEDFRNAMTETSNDTYSVVLRRGKVPMALLNDPKKLSSSHLLTSESYADVFGPKKTRKRPKISATDYGDLLKSAQDKNEQYSEDKDSNVKKENEDKPAVREEIFDKGQSKRIWSELYKVIDSSDVIIQILDSRNPNGTRCRHIEEHLKKNAKHKHLILLLNKCDLIPTWATAQWVQTLSKEYPTLAFHASLTNPFGRGALIQLLRQFSILHNDKKQICVGFIGYPNVGKSSVINALRAKKVCNVAPIPGETKVWQYITLMKRIFLIDCPGVVYESGDSETETVLKGVVRVENLSEPMEYIPGVLERIKRIYIERTYGIAVWEDHVEFLAKLAKKTGKLLKGGEPDFQTTAKMVLYDFQRGRLPFFTPPPFDENYKDDSTEIKSLEGIKVDQKFSSI